MTITAKFPSICPVCGGAISPGQQVEWERGQKARHTDCGAAASAPAAPAAPRAITVERVGRRSYFRGDTLRVRGMLRARGAHWDADHKAWWIGSHDAALALAASATAAPAQAPPVKEVTNCIQCGCALDRFQIQRGYKTCSSDCSIERRMGSGWSGRADRGGWHQGSDD
jgi:predicted nucleic acid-binding Zn ribbon protein